MKKSLKCIIIAHSTNGVYSTCLKHSLAYSLQGMLVSGIEEVLSHWPCLRVSNSDLKCDSQKLVLQLTAKEELNLKQIKTALRSREVIEGVRIKDVIITDSSPNLSRLEIICTVGFIILVVVLMIFCFWTCNRKKSTNQRDIGPSLHHLDVRSNDYIDMRSRPLDLEGGQPPTVSTDGSNKGERPSSSGSSSTGFSSTGFLVRSISLPERET